MTTCEQIEYKVSLLSETLEPTEILTLLFEAIGEEQLNEIYDNIFRERYDDLFAKDEELRQYCVSNYGTRTCTSCEVCQHHLACTYYMLTHEGNTPLN